MTDDDYDDDLDDIDHRCRAAAREAVLVFDQLGPIRIDELDDNPFRLIYPLGAHAVEQVKAALALIDAELPYPAEVNTRVAVQHAVTCQWILHTEGAEEQVMAEMKRQRAIFIDAFENAAGGIVPEMLDEARGWDRKQGGPARNFEEMCQRFSPNNSLYLFNYRHLSDSVHPSFRTAGYHLPADAAGQVVGIERDSPTAADDQLTLPLAFSAIFATNAIASLSQNPDHLAAINDVADRHRLPRDLTGDDQMPHLRRQGR